MAGDVMTIPIKPRSKHGLQCDPTSVIAKPPVAKRPTIGLFAYCAFAYHERPDPLVAFPQVVEQIGCNLYGFSLAAGTIDPTSCRLAAVRFRASRTAAARC